MTSRGFAPSPRPITPFSSSISMRRAAREYPTPSFRCRYEVEALPASKTAAFASAYLSSSASSSIAEKIELVSPFGALPPSEKSTLESGATLFFAMKSTTFFTSPSEMYGACIRRGFDMSFERKSISPAPRSFSAPPVSRMVRESICEDTWKATREGMFALMRPVMTLTDGRCVESTR